MRIIKDYRDEDFLREYGLLSPGLRILNAGSSSVRYDGPTCVNIDIQSKPNVDVVCDLHDLPDSLGTFDAIVCQAVLQYCRDPHLAAAQMHRRLKPGGYLFVDAPWNQPAYEDMADRYRFSPTALREIFGAFEFVKMGPSIRPGSAVGMLGVSVAESLTSSRVMNFALRKTAELGFGLIAGFRTREPERTAGAFYLVCRRGRSDGG